jgi:hypothetical protein
MLVPGLQYAWRVKAANTEGYDRYKNDGYSEVRTFRWGDACEEMLNVTLTPYNNHIRIDWDPQFGHTSYKIKYHNINPHYTLFTDETNLDNHSIRDLKPGETIALSVAGMCGSIEGPFTPEATVTIPYVSPVQSNFECGRPAELIPITGAPPLYVLFPGDVLTGVSGWEFIVEEIEELDGSGVFNGKVRWVIPWFMDGKVGARLENGQVNEDYQLTDGEVVTIYNPTSPFVADARTPRNESTETTTNTDSTSSATTASTTTEITIENTIDSVYVNDDGKIVVLDTAGKETTHDIPKDENGDSKPVTITDGAGNSCTVDEEGNVTKSGEASVSNSSQSKGDIDGSTLTGLDSIVYTILNKIQSEDENKIDSLREHLDELSDQIEEVIVKGGFYPPRIKGPNNELIGEGISEHLDVEAKSEETKSKLSPIINELDEARNNSIEADLSLKVILKSLEFVINKLSSNHFENFVKEITPVISDQSVQETRIIIENLITEFINEN